MGCGSSSAGNKAYLVCRKAQERKAPVNIAELKNAVEGLSAAELDQPEGDYKWTALKCLTLWKGRDQEEDAKSNMGEAARILIAAGADPLGPQFQTGPLGCAIQYERFDVLVAILESLSVSAWETVAGTLTAKRACKKADFVGGEWIEYDGMRGYVIHQLADDAGMTTRIPGLTCTIKLDDSTTKVVDVNEKLVVLPSVYPKVKAELLRTATAAGCSEELLGRLRGLEERGGGYMDFDLFIPGGM